MPINVVYNRPHFDKQMVEAGERLVVIEFTAQWCNASAHSLKKVSDLAANNPDVAFIKIDAEKNRDVADQYNVNALPTFLFLKSGVQDELLTPLRTGAESEQIQVKIESSDLILVKPKEKAI